MSPTQDEEKKGIPAIPTRSETSSKPNAKCGTQNETAALRRRFVLLIIY